MGFILHQRIGQANPYPKPTLRLGPNLYFHFLKFGSKSVGGGDMTYPNLYYYQPPPDIIVKKQKKDCPLLQGQSSILV
mgnify:CR=1 FL=1